MEKTVIISGASRGIGRECALYFKNKGYSVAGLYKNSKKEAEELIDKYGIDMYRCDISDSLSVKDTVLKITDKYKRADCLINNAGISMYGLFQDFKDSELDNIINVNIKGFMYLTREILPFMLREQKGKIINISSMWGVTGGSYEVIYSATKGALISFTKALAKEVAPSGINVNAIAPGVIKTDMIKDFTHEELEDLRNDIPLMRLGNPADVAKTALFLAEEASDYITGQIISVDGGSVI